jgi:hypothetical protein
MPQPWGGCCRSPCGGLRVLHQLAPVIITVLIFLAHPSRQFCPGLCARMSPPPTAACCSSTLPVTPRGGPRPNVLVEELVHRHTTVSSTTTKPTFAYPAARLQHRAQQGAAGVPPEAVLLLPQRAPLTSPRCLPAGAASPGRPAALAAGCPAAADTAETVLLVLPLLLLRVLPLSAASAEASVACRSSTSSAAAPVAPGGSSPCNPGCCIQSCGQLPSQLPQVTW